jgi:uncharacterized membrane protein YraQ (UPF0718 family)
MLPQLLAILEFITNAFLHIWPYLVITIPLAVLVNMSGASKYISRAFAARSLVAILLATVVGAFSPFCSCSVIPVVATLLIGGVPLAPVMAFWIASPSMDPEAFFLSVATIGWELAVWRLVGTLILSLSAGFITHLVMQQGWLGPEILRRKEPPSVQSTWTLLKRGWQRLRRSLEPALAPGIIALTTAPQAVCCASTGDAEPGLTDTRQPVISSTEGISGNSCDASDPQAGSSCSLKPVSFHRRLFDETWAATTMVAKFMALAFFLEALIQLYVPSAWIAGILGNQNPWAIPLAAGLGVPVYTSNLAALPLISGLLAQGMTPAAGLAFLIAGPTTTLPAMAAVWGLASRRVFVLYVSFSLVGAMALGYGYHLVTMLW